MSHEAAPQHPTTAYVTIHVSEGSSRAVHTLHRTTPRLNRLHTISDTPNQFQMCRRLAEHISAQSKLPRSPPLQAQPMTPEIISAKELMSLSKVAYQSGRTKCSSDWCGRRNPHSWMDSSPGRCSAGLVGGRTLPLTTQGRERRRRRRRAAGPLQGRTQEREERR